MITRLGLVLLEQEIKNLKKQLATTIQKRQEAAAEGDLKENSAYIFQGERAQVLRAQISQLEEDYNSAQVQTTPTDTKTISFGHQVTVKYSSGPVMTFTLVGKNDAQHQDNWISVDSPIGLALLGKKKSDQFEVNGQTVTILDIAIGQI